MKKLILEFERKYNHIQESESKFCYVFKNSTQQKFYDSLGRKFIMFFDKDNNPIVKLDTWNMTFTLHYYKMWTIFYNNNEIINFDITSKKISLLLEKYFGYTNFQVCSSPIAI